MEDVERLNRHGHMMHAFASLVIELPLSFEDVSNQPKPKFYEIKKTTFILKESDWKSWVWSVRNRVLWTLDTGGGEGEDLHTGGGEGEDLYTGGHQGASRGLTEELLEASEPTTLN